MISWREWSRRRKFFAVGGFALAVALLSPFWTSPLSPVAVKHEPPLSAQLTLSGAFEEIGAGMSYPEGVALGGKGEIILGTEEGEILELPTGMAEKTSRPRSFAHVAGHSIGIVYDEAQDAYWSATFPLGLQRISRDKGVQTIDAVDGAALAFPDDVALGPDGVVYVTEASTKYNPKTTSADAPYVLWDFIEGRGNGRLISYDPGAGAARTLIDGLAFPSGVALAPDGEALLIVEVTRYRVIRYELTGPNKGAVTVFADRLPGIPDDVFVGPKGEIWVSIVAPREAVMDQFIARHPYVSRVISMLPKGVQNAMLAPAEGGGGLLMLGSGGALLCELRLEKGYPPANGVAWGERLLLGRLGGHELLAIDPAPCSAAMKG